MIVNLRPNAPKPERAMSVVVEKMVDLVGIEPTTSSMPWKRAPNCATGPQSDGVHLFSPDTRGIVKPSGGRKAKPWRRLAFRNWNNLPGVCVALAERG
jgi:hypothetical protein